MLVLLALLFVSSSLVCESFRIPSFQTNRWNGAVQKILPVKSLLCASEEIPPTVALANPEHVGTVNPEDEEEDNPELDKLLEMFDNIASNKTAWDEFNNRTNYEYNDAVYNNLRNYWICNTCYSTKSPVSANEILAMLQDRWITPSGVPVREYLEIMSHHDAIGKVYSVVKAKTPLTKHFLDTLNILLAGHWRSITATHPDGYNITYACVSGDYRAMEVGFRTNITRACINATDVPKGMEDIYQFCNTSAADLDIHPIELAVIVLHQYTMIHPYENAHERQAQLLMAYLLMREGLPPPIMFKKHRAEYLQALELLIQGNLIPMYTFMAARVHEVQDIMWTVNPYQYTLCTHNGTDDEVST